MFMGQTRQEVKRPKNGFYFLTSACSPGPQYGLYPKNTAKATIKNVRPVPCTCLTWLKFAPQLGHFSKNYWYTMFEASSLVKISKKKIKMFLKNSQSLCYHVSKTPPDLEFR